MRSIMKPGRRRFAALTAPAAVLGSLAASLAPTAAHAQEPTPTAAPLHAPPAPPLAAMPAADFAAGSRVMEAAHPASYTVKRGDTISSIAARHSLGTADVLRWNGLDWATIIRPGQQIRLTEQDSHAAAPAPASRTVAVTHTVARGDTVYAIAQKHGTTVSALLEANGIGPQAIIYPGEELRVPGQPVVAASGSADTATQKTATLNAPQIENARLIIRIGRELGVPDRGIAIALGTAMVESWIRNLDWGDRDSLGLFQQRPSTGWGTPDQVRTRERAIRAFYGGPGNPNRGITRGLLDIADWQTMGFAQAAQAVQISAHPERYGQWEAAAYQWLEQYG